MSISADPLLAQVAHLFVERMPFNRLLGLAIPRFDLDGVEVCFAMDDKLIGNPASGILHGGVTAAVLDVAGGLMAIAGAAERLKRLEPAEMSKRLARISTIDLRIDYLRPGHGLQFTASAEIIRSGSRVAVCRMELHNEQRVHIAYGTGTYMVG